MIVPSNSVPNGTPLFFDYNLLKLKGRVGGERGIRTPEELAPLLLFESSAFNHSATSPRGDPITARIDHIQPLGLDLTVAYMIVDYVWNG